MSLIIPAMSSTYGDSSKTEGCALNRKYVLGQFRSNADLDWVQRLRAALSSDELKYAHFREVRHRLHAQKQLWKLIESGVGQATIVVVDPEPVEMQVREYVKSEKITPEDGATEKAIIENCATAIIGKTPIAYPWVWVL